MASEWKQGLLNCFGDCGTCKNYLVAVVAVVVIVSCSFLSTASAALDHLEQLVRVLGSETVFIEDALDIGCLLVIVGWLLDVGVVLVVGCLCFHPGCLGCWCPCCLVYQNAEVQYSSYCCCFTFEFLCSVPLPDRSDTCSSQGLEKPGIICCLLGCIMPCIPTLLLRSSSSISPSLLSSLLSSSSSLL